MSSPITTESLWQKYRKTKSLKIRNIIVIQNEGLVFKVANNWAERCPEPVEDLVNLGMIGLIRAIERYDPEMGAAFSSFAVPFISGEIHHFLRDHWPGLKVPRRAWEDKSKVEGIQRKMLQSGRAITLDMAARAVGINKERWTWISEATQRKQMASLDEILELADEPIELSREALRRKVLEAIAKLPKTQKRYVIGAFFQNLSYEAIAKREAVPVAEVEALINEAVLNLKRELEHVYAEHI